MNYAIIENGIVTNIIVGLPIGIAGIPIEDNNVAIGDQYVDGQFISNQVASLSLVEQIDILEQKILAMQELLKANNIPSD